MLINDETLSRLLDAVETQYLENIVLRSVLTAKGWTAMDKVLAEAKADPKMKDRVRAKFAPLRAGLLEEAALEQALQEFLKANPPKNVN